jgi:hypothetical protein
MLCHHVDYVHEAHYGTTDELFGLWLLASLGQFSFSMLPETWTAMVPQR